ncbi:MAG: YraN family protein [Clostridiales bacterium]|jgi:putative endonuclease|nr:YraN family protein [Clostridiales bacterium]
MDKITFGAVGEESAARFLERKGYRVLENNYKCRFGEIDVVAMDGDTLVFVEVKHRATLKYGRPAEAVNTRKQYKISQVAAAYIKSKKLYDAPARFDVIEVLDNRWVNHIENAFYSMISF